MIAEAASRRKGLGSEALALLMGYAICFLSVSSFVAKIGYANEASQALFKSLGYIEAKRVDVFQEVHFVLNASLCSDRWRHYQGQQLCIETHR